jgi:hypothetical protein
VAAATGMGDVCRVLVERGCDADRPNARGATARGQALGEAEEALGAPGAGGSA